MTSACGGGTSAAKPGTDVIVRYSAGLLAAIFAVLDIPWLIPVIPLVGLADIPVASFCASDPPAIPTFTSAESDAILNLSFGADFDSGLAKLKDLALHSIWYDLCECTSGTLAPFVAPTPPAGTPIYQVPRPGLVGNCGQTGPFSTFSLCGGNNSGLVFSLVPFNGLNVTGAQVTLRRYASTGGGQTAVFTLNWYDATHIIRNDTLTIGSSDATYTQFVGPPPAGAMFAGALVQGLSGGCSTYETTIELFCNGSGPTTVQQPCCPPDVSTQSQLDAILRMVTLIQRQEVPFAYVASTAHAGLTGAGSIAIQGLLGASVNCTTIPASYGREDTSPTEYFDLGFVSFSTPDGYPTSYRLDKQKRLCLPSRAGLYTQLDYDLSPGVVVTITELLREP